MLVVNLITSFIYLMLFIISFRSFLIKEDFRFHVSLNISYSFFLWFIISTVKIFVIPEAIYYSLISLDFYALFLLFHSTTKIRSALTEYPILIRRKLFNIMFLLTASVSVFFLGNRMFAGDISSVILIKDIANFFLVLLMNIHLPSFKEYKYLKIGIFIISFKYFIAMMGHFFSQPAFAEILMTFLPVIALPIFLWHLHNLYVQSIEKELESKKRVDSK